MPIRVILIGLLLLAIAETAYAGRGDTVEIVQQQGLFLLEDFQQWAGVNYQYSGHASNGSSGGFASHRLEELYHIQTNVAILSPHFLDFQLGGDLGVDQLYNTSDLSGSSSGNSLRYEYNLDVSALDRSWHPVEIFSSRTRDTVVTPFSPTLDTDVSRNGIAVLFLRDPLRARFRYETNSQTVTGGGSDATSISDSFQAAVSHNYRDINSFSLDFALNATKSGQEGVDQNGYGNALNASDSIFWGEGRRYSLVSEVQRQFTSTNELPQTTLYWNETLLGHLGKALDAELDSRYNSNLTTISQGVSQTYQTEALVGQIRHHLFQSLDTRLIGTYSESGLPGGSEDTYSGQAGLGYRKMLPASSMLKFDVSGEHDVTDRRGQASQIKVVNESQSVTQPFQVITLKQTGSLQPGSVLVQGYLIPPANSQVPPDKVYAEGVDYTVDLTGGRITWGPIPPPVSQIVVSYTVLLDPSVKYATDTLNLTSTLALFNGRYQFTASYYSQKRSLISGSSDNGLFNTEITTLRGQKYTDTQNYSLEYSNYLAGPSQYQYLEAGWQYTPLLQDYVVQVQARDRYTMYGATDITPAHDDNTLSVAASGSSTLFGRMLCLLTANAIDERGNSILSNDSLFLRFSLRGRFNQLLITFVGSTGWRFAGTSTTRDDNVRLEIVRYF